MIPCDYIEYRPWITLDQGTKPHCQAYAFFGVLMEIIENKYGLKLEFDIDGYFKELEAIFKKAPKNEGANPRQWYYYDYAMNEGFKAKTGEVVKVNAFRHIQYFHRLDLILTCLQKAPVQIAISTYENYPLNISGDILPSLPSKLIPKGGHEMFLIGFDRSRKLFLVQNSWGDDVGAKWMPFEVFQKLALHAFFIQEITLIK